MRPFRGRYASRKNMKRAMGGGKASVGGYYIGPVQTDRTGNRYVKLTAFRRKVLSSV